MLIIIEGADKTGKTTLAKEITERYGYRYHHFGPPGPNPAEEYAEFLINLKEPVVCDRFFYGEMVYGPLLRGKSLMTTRQINMIEQMCLAHNAYLIHAEPKLDIINNRMHELGDDMITVEQNEKAYGMFNTVISKAILPKLKYDSAKPMEEFLKYLEEKYWL